MHLLNSSEAAAYAAWLSRVGCIIGNNEITKAAGKMKYFSCELFDTNSEESAISAAVGRVFNGRRALLTDLVWLKPASRYRVPLVSISAGFRNWCLNFLPGSAQEMLDMVLAAYLLSEDRKVLLPVNVVTDKLGQDTFEFVDVPGQKIIDNLLGPFKLDKYEKHLQYAGHRLEHSSQIAKAVENSYRTMPQFSKEWKRRFRRTFDLTEKFMLDDAEIAFIAYGWSSSNAKLAVQKLRQEGHKIGLLQLKAITPFPTKEVADALKNVKRLAVVDRQVLTGTWSKLYYLCKPAYGGFASNFISDDTVTVAGFVDIGRRLKAAEEEERIWMM